MIAANLNMTATVQPFRHPPQTANTLTSDNRVYHQRSQSRDDPIDVSQSLAIGLRHTPVVPVTHSQLLDFNGW